LIITIQRAIATYEAEAQRLQSRLVVLHRTLSELQKLDEVRECMKAPTQDPTGAPSRSLKDRIDAMVQRSAGARYNPRSRDLIGMRLVDAAEAILKEADGQWLSALRIAELAVERGYESSSSKNPGNDPEKIGRSVYLTLRNYGARFDRRGKMFRARQSAPPADAAGQQSLIELDDDDRIDE
jgi:hypothetical protein